MFRRQISCELAVLLSCAQRALTVSMTLLLPETKALTSLLLALLVAIPTIKAAAFTPNEPLSWADVLAWIRHEWPEIPRMSTEELARRLRVDGDRRPLLIDVRSRGEYEVSHLQGAVWAESPHQIEDAVNRHAKGEVIVLYCSVGVRSSRAAAKLMKLGYSDVFTLQGSIFQWANEGRPVFRSSKIVDVVHPYNERWAVLLDAPLHAESQR